MTAERQTLAGQLAELLEVWKRARGLAVEQMERGVTEPTRQHARIKVGIYNIFIGEIADLLRRFDWPV